ncbi:MAG: hypothetical protein JWR15_4002 [Prosthecobacter sp.]|nr:hypothetical protein [Prosthecobacter sp.]
MMVPQPPSESPLASSKKYQPPPLITMQIQRALNCWRPSPARALAFLFLLCTAGWQRAAAEVPPPQISTEQLEALMLPPPGWKLNSKELSNYFWLQPIWATNEVPGSIVIHPFWPAFNAMDLDAELCVSERLPGYNGSLGGLLADGLNSADPAVKRRAALWLRHSLILYFTGIRLSTLNGVKPYAPWIKPEDVRRLEQLADHFLAGLKPMHSTGPQPEEISHFQLVEWLSDPGGRSIAAVGSYFDFLNAGTWSLSAEFVHPIDWSWRRSRGNKDLSLLLEYAMEDLGNYTALSLMGGKEPTAREPRGLWLREVYLSFIAGKELFESKHLPMTDKAKAALLKDALQQWWAGIEKEK